MSQYSHKFPGSDAICLTAQTEVICYGYTKDLTYFQIKQIICLHQAIRKHVTKH